MIDNAITITAPYGEFLKITSSNLGTFWKKTLSVNITASVGGSVEGIPVVWKYEDVVRLSAIPEEGYVFEHWSDGDENTIKELTATTDFDLTASFIEE